MHLHRIPSLVALALAAIAAVATNAGADERVAATVTFAAAPTPLVTSNGVPSCTLRLEYTHIGTQFPAGAFATFDLRLALVPTGTGPASVYPADLSLRQTGSPNLELLALPDAFDVTDASWTGQSAVIVWIPAAVATDPAMNVDGAELVANLQIDANGGSRLKTPTSVQVKVRLVHPTSCVRQYTFISDRENETVVNSMALRYGTRGGNLNKITNVHPSQVNQNVLLVNVCPEDEVVDVRVAMDSRFVFGPGGGPAHAVFIYSTAGQLSPGPIDVSTLTAGPVLGKVTDIAGVALPGGTSVLIKLHLKLNPDLDRFGVGTSPFVFESRAYEPSGYSQLHVPTDPNPASVAVPFTLTPQN